MGQVRGGCSDAHLTGIRILWVSLWLCWAVVCTCRLPLPAFHLDLQVNKVAGNFHFAPGRSYQQGNMHVHDIAPFGDALLDFTHSIHKLSFGKSYPGMKNPLDGVKVRRPPPGPQGHVTGMYQYFLKVGGEEISKVPQPLPLPLPVPSDPVTLVLLSVFWPGPHVQIDLIFLTCFPSGCANGVLIHQQPDGQHQSVFSD